MTKPKTEIIARDLLKALKDLMDVIEADQLVPESVSYMIQARQAIAKAEGKNIS